MARRTVKVGGGIELPYPVPSSDRASRAGIGNRRTDTIPELRIRSALHRKRHRFRKDHPVRAGSILVRPDVVFTRKQVAVFVDGCFWHSCPIHGSQPKTNSSYWKPKLGRNVERDRQVGEALRADGWKVLRYWEHEPVEQVVSSVEEALLDQRS